MIVGASTNIHVDSVEGTVIKKNDWLIGKITHLSGFPKKEARTGNG